MSSNQFYNFQGVNYPFSRKSFTGKLKFKEKHEFDRKSVIKAKEIIIAFSFFANDRYRTAAAMFRYRIDEFTYISMQTTLWTGDPFYRTIQPIYEDYPNSSGYEDMTGSRFTANSHGILAMQIIRLLPYQQQVLMNLGIDAEQVRHALQNRFIHDMPFIPKGWHLPRQPHIPMVAEDGKPYLYQEGQVIRKARFWGNVNINTPIFY